MDRLLADACLTPIFIRKQWFARGDFDLIQAGIQETCFRIFRERTRAAAARLDTAVEYRRVRKKVKETCD